MKLISVELNNFRQYYGQQRIDFSEGEKNITIIFGLNGEGKTGLFRALMFGLFGDKELDQDDAKSNNMLHLVNFIALDEHLNQPVQAKVKIRFEDQEELYEIERTIAGIKDDQNKIIERIQSPVLYIGDDVNLHSNGITDENEIKQIMNGVINDKIKKFFFFDGDRIDTLSTTNNREREEVKEAIKNLMQINTLDTSINIVKRLKAAQNREIKKNNKDTDLKAAYDEFEKIENELSDYKKKIENETLEIENCSNELNKINEKIEESSDLKNSLNEMNDLENRIKEYDEDIARCKKQIKELLVEKGSTLLISDYYENEKSYLESVANENNSVPIELLNLSLKNKKCACCGNDLTKDNLALHYIETLKRNYKSNEVKGLLRLMFDSIHEIEEEKDSDIDDIKENLMLYSNKKSKRNIVYNKLAPLMDKKEDIINQNKNLSELEAKKLKIRKNYDDYKTHVIVLNEKIKSLSSKKDELEKRINKITSARSEYQEQSETIEKINILLNRLEKMFNKYSNEMRKNLSDTATTIFSNIIDEKDKDLISKIEINPKYEIVLKNRDGIDITPDISMGQRRIVSISFITALSKVATGDNDKIDFPLFMDTPFGTISGNNRDHLISNIPKMTSQWILLLTDTELTSAEELQIKNTGKLGCWYLLDQKEEYKTQIVKKSVNEQMSRR